MRGAALVIFGGLVVSGTALSGTALAQITGVRSDIRDVVLVKAERVPPNPTKPTIPFCDHYVAAPKSAGAKVVAAAGWHVMSEARIGTHDIVAFAGDFTPGTSAVCRVENGNIGFFEGSHLVALAYSSHPSDFAIGGVAPGPAATIRLQSGEGPSAPIGDFVLNGSELVLARLPKADRVCGGKGLMPNVFDQSIRTAHKRIVAAGWRASPPQKPDKDNAQREYGLYRKGISSVDSCSGTGYAFCSFAYASSAGALTVITVGEGPETVIDYTVACK